MSEPNAKVVDMQGRPAVSSMSDRELAEETVLMLRQFADAISALAANPMVKTMLPGMGLKL